MSRYPREACSARIKCIACSAPVVRTAEGKHACVDCGSPVRSHTETVPAAD